MPAREGATRMPRTTRLKPHSNLLGDMAVGPSSTLMSLHVAQKVRLFKRYGGTTTWRSTPCRAALWTACKEGRAGCRALAGTTHTCTSLRRRSHQRSGTPAYGCMHGPLRTQSVRSARLLLCCLFKCRCELICGCAGRETGRVKSIEPDSLNASARNSPHTIRGIMRRN